MAAVAKSPSSHWASRALGAPLHRVVGWYRVSQERAALGSLPPERLNDLGLTPDAVRCELRRPFWQAR